MRSDIARFFPSIYTHSISWAFHGKAAAKADHSSALFGNDIDTHFRNLQDKQTIGIPIGQDISRVIAEAILSHVEELMRIKKWPPGIRCIDDYEIGFLTATEAEEFRHKLERALTEFELALNPLKTAILPLPQLLLDRWDAELRRFDFESALPDFTPGDDDEEPARLPFDDYLFAPPAKREQLLLFFNKAIELQLQHRDEAVLRFSLKRVAHLRMTKESWPLYQDYLFHCGLNQPETLRLVVSNLLKAVLLDDMPLDKSKLRLVINAVIKAAAPLGHSSDVSWALWAALLFKVKISPAAALELETFEDSVSACLACETHKRGLLPKRFDPKWISTALGSKRSMYGEHWLLAYEANRNGWPGRGPNPLDACFSYLKAEGVRFFIEDHAEYLRRELRNLARAKKRAPTSFDDEDDSDSEDAFDNWWFSDDD